MWTVGRPEWSSARLLGVISRPAFGGTDSLITLELDEEGGELLAEGPSNLKGFDETLISRGRGGGAGLSNPKGFDETVLSRQSNL